MNPSEKIPEHTIAKAEYDPNDIWDNWLVDTCGKTSWLTPHHETTEPADVLIRYDNAITNHEGDIIDPDGGHFGSFAGTDGEWQLDTPSYIPTPEEMEKHLDGSLKVRVDYTIHFQVDGPKADGHVWQARLFDQTTQKEIPHTRVLSNKLSYVMSAVLTHMPEQGNEYVSVEDFLADILNEAHSIDEEIDRCEIEDKEIQKKYPEYTATDFFALIIDQDEKFADLFMEGNMSDYIKRNMDQIKTISDEHERMAQARTFKKDFYKLSSIFHKISQDMMLKQYNFIQHKHKPGSDDRADDWKKG